jgi:hypothetical protein
MSMLDPTPLEAAWPGVCRMAWHVQDGLARARAILHARRAGQAQLQDFVLRAPGRTPAGVGQLVLSLFVTELSDQHPSTVSAAAAACMLWCGTCLDRAQTGCWSRRTLADGVSCKPRAESCTLMFLGLQHARMLQRAALSRVLTHTCWGAC